MHTQAAQPVFKQALQEMPEQTAETAHPAAHPDTQLTSPRPCGLVLSGGGARAAYQVGVLQAISQLLSRPDAAQAAGKEGGAQADTDPRIVREANPFPILVGTSAGAINATALASGANHFHNAVERIAEVWDNFHADEVYRSDSFGVIRTGARWLTLMSFGWALRKWSRARPKSLLDNAPLRELLTRMIDPERVERHLGSGCLQALAVSVSSYSSGEHVTFYQSSHGIEPWERSKRIAVNETIDIDHLMASSAIPFVFPAVPLMLEGRREYFGDGSMRQVAPISPAIHLGARKILVVGAGRLQEPPPPPDQPDATYPSVAQIAGHALSSIFLDGLSSDIERLLRINRTLELLTDEARRKTALRPIDILVISPSQRLDEIAGRHTHSLPLPIRTLLGGLGATETRYAALASYLLFETGYTRELMALGRADTLERHDEVLKFLQS